MSQAARIETQLRANRLPVIGDVLPADEYVMPHYDGLGIANLPSTLAVLLGGELPGACPPLQRDLWDKWTAGLRRVVLVVFDALGYLQLQAAMQTDDGLIFHRLAEAGSMVPLTSTFPSTTCTALTTLWSGYGPAAHGSLVFEVYLREWSTPASLLFFWPLGCRRRDSLAQWGLDPKTFIPVPALGEQLAGQGIVTHALIDKAYSTSLFTQTLQRGVQGCDGLIGQGDTWLGLQRAIEKHLHEKLFLTLYCGTVDGITHQYSPADLSWNLELRGLSRMMEEGFLAQLTYRQREGTLLLITADHGGVSTLPQDAIRMEHHPDLHDALRLPPLGEGRAPFLYARGGKLEFVQAYMRERLRTAFVTLTGEQVLQSKLLGPGPIYAETPHRLGDLIALARGNHYLARDEHQLKMKGRHGSLSAEEMLVPLIGVRLDAL